MPNQLKQTRTQAWLLIASAIIAVTGTLVGALTGGWLLYISAAFWLIMSLTRTIQRGQSISIPYKFILPDFFDFMLPYTLSPPKVRTDSIWRDIINERQILKRRDEIAKEELRQMYYPSMMTTLRGPSWIRAFVKVLSWRFLSFSIGFGRFWVSWPFREIWQQIKFLRQHSP